MTDFSDPDDVKQAVLAYVKNHDGCDSDEVSRAVGPEQLLAQRKATGLTLRALVGNGAISGGSATPTTEPSSSPMMTGTFGGQTWLSFDGPGPLRA